MADKDRPLPGRTEGTEAVHIRTFLIADVRGYTLFTQERGDEAATKLAACFAEIAVRWSMGRRLSDRAPYPACLRLKGAFEPGSSA